MRLTYSFWFLFSILEDCYFKCYEGDLGGLLGEISPYLWSNFTPMDMATVNDWSVICKEQGFCEKNAIDCVVHFLESYEKKYGFSFKKAKETIRKLERDEVTEIQKKSHQLAARYGEVGHVGHGDVWTK